MRDEHDIPTVSLTGRSILCLADCTDVEIRYLLRLAADLKRKKRGEIRGDLLQRKNIALIFEKASTRTRCAFIVAAVDEGAHAENLSSQDTHLGRKESVVDTARVLGRMFDGLAFRGYAHETVELLAKHSGVPVWNALTDDTHPTQVLADLLTIEEHFERLRGLKLVYLGDGRNNVANSLMIGCARMGMHFVNCTPVELNPDERRLAESTDVAEANGGSVRLCHDPAEAVQGANVLYTDVWASMGEESLFQERLALLRPYQVTMDLMRATGNLDSGQAIFLHCLPAYHDHDTEVTRETGALEVTDEVFSSSASLVFEQAENRVHSIKAVMVATLT